MKLKQKRTTTGLPKKDLQKLSTEFSTLSLSIFNTKTDLSEFTMMSVSKVESYFGHQEGRSIKLSYNKTTTLGLENIKIKIF